MVLGHSAEHRVRVRGRHGGKSIPHGRPRVEAGSGTSAGGAGRGSWWGVERGGGCARGTVGVGVRACGVDEVRGRGPCG